MIATPSPIFAMTRARRAANSSGGKMSDPVKTGWAERGRVRRMRAHERVIRSSLLRAGGMARMRGRHLAGLLVPLRRLHFQQMPHEEVLHQMQPVHRIRALGSVPAARDEQQIELLV